MSIDIAVIGCGYRGRKLIQNFEAVESLNLVKVYDILEDRMEEIQKEYLQVMIAKNYKSVLKDPTIDAITIATPVSTHYQLVKESLLSNKHVLVEKPLTMRSEEARELIDISQEKGKVLMVDDTVLFNGKVLAIKGLLDKNEIGELYYIDAVRANLNNLKPMDMSTGFYPDTGVVWDLAPHDVAMMAFLIDAYPIRVVANGVNSIEYCSDNRTIVAWFSVTFDNGIIGHFHVNWLAPEQMERIVIAGSDKMIVYDDLNPDRPITLYDKGVDLLPVSTPDEPMLVRYREGETKNISWDTRDPIQGMVEHFRNCILEGREPVSNASFAHRVVTILEATERSISLRGEPVEANMYSDVTSRL
jgi:predicted dehydrogenase